MKTEIKRKKRFRRHRRVRARVFGTAARPRFCVFQSGKHIYAQLIDDEKGRTLASANDQELKQKAKGKKQKIKKGKPSFAPAFVKTSASVLRTSADKSAGKKASEGKEEKRTGKVAIAYEVGKLIAEKVLAKKIEKVVFDRGSYKYHGRVKAVADGAREGGLKF